MWGTKAKSYSHLTTYSHKAYNKNLELNPDPMGPISCLPQHAFSSFISICLGLYLLTYFYLKTLQHNTITHRESKALVPNTTPSSSLGLVEASILSEAFLYIPASQERSALPLQSSEPLEKQFLHSGYLHSQHLSLGNQTLQPLLAEFSLGTLPFCLQIFLLYIVSAQKKGFWYL